MQTTEQMFSEVVLWILSELPSGNATYQELYKEIQKRVVLTDEDKIASTTRNGEPVWRQIVRNITSHHDQEWNYIFQGYLERIESGLSITPAGRLKVGR